MGCAAGTNVTNGLGGAALGSALGILAHVSTQDYKEAAPVPNRMFAEIASK